MNLRNDRTDLAHRLILRAARRAPAALSERLEEEWLADLGSRNGSLARLRLAFGCCWATGIITHDFRVPQLATSGAASGHKPLLGDLRYGLPLLSRRTIAFIVIAGVHVLIIYGFMSGLAQQVVATIPILSHATVELQPTPARPAPPPLLPDPTLTKFPAEKFPPPEPPTFTVATDPTLSPGEVTQGPQSIDPPSQPPPVRQVLGGPGKGFPNTDDYYPAASRRLGETGATTVQVCVNTQGRLNAEPTVAQTSGSRRIDEGALNLAKAGSGHYRPTLANGQPVNTCFPYRIRFTLSN